MTFFLYNTMFPGKLIKIDCNLLEEQWCYSGPKLFLAISLEVSTAMYLYSKLNSIFWKRFSRNIRKLNIFNDKYWYALFNITYLFFLSLLPWKHLTIRRIFPCERILGFVRKTDKMLHLPMYLQMPAKYTKYQRIAQYISTLDNIFVEVTYRYFAN